MTKSCVGGAGCPTASRSVGNFDKVVGQRGERPTVLSEVTAGVLRHHLRLCGVAPKRGKVIGVRPKRLEILIQVHGSCGCAYWVAVARMRAGQVPRSKLATLVLHIWRLFQSSLALPLISESSAPGIREPGCRGGHMTSELFFLPLTCRETWVPRGTYRPGSQPTILACCGGAHQTRWLVHRG